MPHTGPTAGDARPRPRPPHQQTIGARADLQPLLCGRSGCLNLGTLAPPGCKTGEAEDVIGQKTACGRASDPINAEKQRPLAYPDGVKAANATK